MENVEINLDEENALCGDEIEKEQENLEIPADQNEDEDTRVRRLIYERLGLAFGSLANEGGNDWMRAKEEVLAELKEQDREQTNMQSDEISGDKAEILSEFSPENEQKILELIASTRLNQDEIDGLINFNKKDIFIALTRSQILSEEQILKILPNAPYLAVEMILKHQNFAPVREEIIKKIMLQPMIYKEIIADLKASKW